MIINSDEKAERSDVCRVGVVGVMIVKKNVIVCRDSYIDTRTSCDRETVLNTAAASLSSHVLDMFYDETLFCSKSC